MKALYARVSTVEQSIKGYSLDNQIDECIKKANTNEVLQYVDDGFTGELLQRPALDKMRDDIDKGIIDTVICYDPDRLSRKLMVQLLLDDEFKKKNVELVFVNGDYAKTPEGQLFFSLRGAISEFEKAKIKERTAGGKRRKAKRGLIVQNTHIYGYNYIKEKHMLEINEEESKIIKMIFDYYTTQTKGLHGIASHLNVLGVPTKKGGKQWYTQVIKKILRNETYVGRYIQNKYDTEGNYVRKQSGEKVALKFRPEEEWVVSEVPAIVEEEQYQLAQLLLEQGRRRSTKIGNHAYLLSGLVRCGNCNESMVGTRSKDVKTGKSYYSYKCKKKNGGVVTGCGRQISENKINDFVWTQVESLFKDPDQINTHKENEDKSFAHREIKHIEQEIEKTKKGRKRLFTLVSLSEDDDIDLEEIKDQIKTLQNKENDLLIKYNELTKQLKDNESHSPNKESLEMGMKLYFEHDPEFEFTFEEKQTLIRKIVKEVIYVDKETANIYLF